MTTYDSYSSLSYTFETFLRSKLNGAVFINLKILTVEGHFGAFMIVTSQLRFSLKFSGIRYFACRNHGIVQENRGGMVQENRGISSM